MAVAAHFTCQTKRGQFIALRHGVPVLHVVNIAYNEPLCITRKRKLPGRKIGLFYLYVQERKQLKNP